MPSNSCFLGKAPRTWPTAFGTRSSAPLFFEAISPRPCQAVKLGSAVFSENAHSDAMRPACSNDTGLIP